MDNPSAVRVMLKNGAKRRLMRYFPSCAGVSIVSGVLTTLLSWILSSQLPDTQTLLQLSDLSPYYAQFALFYGLSFLFTLLLSPLTIGSYAFYMDVSRDKRPAFTSIFTWLGELSKAKAAYAASLWFVLLTLKYLAIYTLLPAVLVCAVAFLPSAIADWLIYLISSLTLLFLIVGSVFASAHINACLPALYLLAENPSLGIRRTFAFCERQMKTYIWQFFLFRLSFLLWDMLGTFTYGLSLVFVTPYINLSVSGYTNWWLVSLRDSYLQTPPSADDPDMTLLAQLLQTRSQRDTALTQDSNSDSIGDNRQ